MSRYRLGRLMPVTVPAWWYLMRLVFSTFMAVSILSTPGMAEWVTDLYGPHAIVAVAETGSVNESSGVVASRTSSHVYWTHNDSGGLPRVYAFRLSDEDRLTETARHLGYVELLGASVIDWEDVAAGPNNQIYVFDGGDNPPCGRTDKRIHRFVEPTIDPDGSPIAVTVGYETMRFEYPDSGNPALPADSDIERFDAEGLFIRPETSDIYIVTKRTNANTPAARVFKRRGDTINWNSNDIHVLEFVADISAQVTGHATAADIAPSGRRIVIRDYATAYEYSLPAGADFDSIIQQVPKTLSLLGEIQGEGICYAADGGNLVSTSEVQVIGPETFPVFVTPWGLANTRATRLRATSASVTWDSALAQDSAVAYGETVSYGMTVQDATPVYSHTIQLTDLAPDTTYFFRITSGSDSYPPPVLASSESFTTLHTVRSDFDEDLDVDLDDFGLLQRCFTGAGVPQLELECVEARLDGDTDVDQADFAVFIGCIKGTGLPVDFACDP